MRRSAAAEARAGPRAGATAAFAVALAVALGCAGGAPKRREPPEPALRIWTPGIVRWSGPRREVVLEVENGTQRTVRLEAPEPRRARAIVFAGAEDDRVCGQEADDTAPAREVVALGPGEAREVRIDLGDACRRLPPGEYRLELGYEAPAAGPGPAVRLRPRHARVVVEGGGPPSVDRWDLGGLGSGADAPRAPRRPRSTQK